MLSLSVSWFSVMSCIQMAGDKVTGFDFFKLRPFFCADFFCKPAAGAESAATGRIHRRRNIAFQDNTLAVFFDLRIRIRHSGEQRLGIGMSGFL